MCGLAGIYSHDQRPVDIEALMRMRELMRLRGPDGAGLWFDQRKGIALAHRRLAILDLTERGAQPMASPDGQLRVVFNGEIYNHPELRTWCESRGARYVSDSDTETLLHLYALEGREFVKRLRGMFAFALWDDRERSVLLARDPFGIKPLYYTSDNGQFCFASQVKALLAGGIDATVNPAGVASFLIWGYVTEPHTWYRSIRPVPAGSTVTLRRDGRADTILYHEPMDSLRKHAQPIAAGRCLRDAVLDSVRHHLLADVPVGLFLSAGVDSGALCGLVSENVNPETLHGVTLGFEEYKGTAEDEVPVARAVAKYYGCRHSVITYSQEDFREAREGLLGAMDQPTVDGINTYFVSKAAAEAGLKVALSGVGGDEIFGGYPSFKQVPYLARKLKFVPRNLGSAMRSVLAPIIARFTSPKYASLLEYGGSISGAYLLRRALFMPWEIADILGNDMAAAGLESLDIMNTLDGITRDIPSSFEKVMALEHTIYLRNCLLRDADWAGMAHSLEIRTPLVDSTLFDELVALRRCGAQRNPTKHDFAQTPDRNLPPEQQARPKSGFNIPVREWLTGGGRQDSHERGRRSWARSLTKCANVIVNEK